MVGPSLTVNLTGNPFVEVFFDPVNLAVGTARITIYRLSEGREWLVRGGVDIATDVAALDFEAPFQSLCTYRAEQFDAFGNSLGFTDSSTVTVDFTGTVVHQPLAPAELWASVLLLAPSAESLTRPTTGEFVQVEGSAVGRWIGAMRQGLRGVPVVLATETLAAANQLQATLGTYVTQQVGVLCIRTSEGIRWPRTFFARGDLAEVERNLKYQGELIEFRSEMDETEPPYPGLVVPLLTYDDLDAFGDYAAQDANWITYTARDRAYELAGLAG